MVVTSTRFLVVRVQLLDGRPPPTLSVLNAAIRDSVHENFGDFGAGLILTSFQSAAALTVARALAAARLTARGLSNGEPDAKENGEAARAGGCDMSQSSELARRDSCARAARRTDADAHAARRRCGAHSTRRW